MAKLERTENQYNTTCDTYGCSNIAKHVIGKIGEGQAQKILLCDECLQEIINLAPIDMILNRPELAEVEENEPGTSNIGRQEDDPMGLENVGKALEGEEDLHELKYPQLREIATEKGIKVPFGTSRDELIEMIKASA